MSRNNGSSSSDRAQVDGSAAVGRGAQSGAGEMCGTDGVGGVGGVGGLQMDRRTNPDRRVYGDDPRFGPGVSAGDGSDGGGADGTGLERRRGPGRRRSDFMRSAEEGEMTGEQFLFLMAIDAFKKANNKTFPTWTDVVEIIRLLGYRKTLSSELNLPQAEDWTEPASAPSRVRDDSEQFARVRKKTQVGPDRRKAA